MGKVTQTKSRDHATPKGKATKRFCTQRYYCRAGLRKPAFENGECSVAVFSAIHKKKVRARAKYAVIYRHQEQYPVLAICQFFSVSRSGYYSYIKRDGPARKDAGLAEMIRQRQDKGFHIYGYRSMWQWLKSTGEIYHNPKTILRVMKKCGLLAEIRRSRKWQQRGATGPQIPKSSQPRLSRRSTEPQMCKWVTDISYI